MKRSDVHRPTIEDLVEASGIEILHPGGTELTRRTGEVVRLAPGMSVLDVSSGRGTQSIFYAKEFGVKVTGLDISDEMLASAAKNAEEAGVGDRVSFRKGDSQNLPFANDSFDAVINECAVGIPDDSQKVLDEMVRVVKPGGAIAIHESTWKAAMTTEEKDEISNRYGTTPLEKDEWITMMEKAGAGAVAYELERWSKPEMFWDIRKGRKVSAPDKVMSFRERAATIWRVAGRYGLSGVAKAYENEKIFHETVLGGKLGYGLYWAHKPEV